MLLWLLLFFFFFTVIMDCFCLMHFATCCRVHYGDNEGQSFKACHLFFTSNIFTCNMVMTTDIAWILELRASCFSPKAFIIRVLIQPFLVFFSYFLPFLSLFRSLFVSLFLSLFFSFRLLFIIFPLNTENVGVGSIFWV